MSRKIFKSIFGVAALTVILGLALLMAVLYRYFIRNEFMQLKIQTELAAQGITLEEQDYLKQLRTDGYRLTWIDADGTVKYDSAADASVMENHSGRTEVKEALESGTGESRRYSATLSEETLYSARKLADGTVVRISVTQKSVLTLVWGMLWPLALVLFAAMMFSVFLGRHVAFQIVKPINSLNLDSPLENDTYEEITPLLRRMEEQRKEILNREMELGKKQAEFSSLTRNMDEGMILLNEKERILSMNNSARRLFHVSGNPYGTDFMILNHSLPMQELMQRAKKEEHAEQVLELENRTYRFIATPVNSGGLVILSVDETDRAEAEKMRREFTANVSHELKTPLQSIQATVELLQNGLVQEKDMPEFLNRMQRETSRMTSLIHDIIRLSQLDEGEVAREKETADLSEVAEEAVRSLREKAQKLSVKIVPDLKSSPVYGIRQLYSETVVNLLDNAIKYNKENGEVEISTGTEGTDAVLTVKDTGIGIPKEDQPHVFERFYRADKSRSRENGGTGLGLSIVKHAVQINGGVIDLCSNPGEGTCITVRFPVQNV